MTKPGVSYYFSLQEGGEFFINSDCRIKLLELWESQANTQAQDMFKTLKNAMRDLQSDVNTKVTTTIRDTEMELNK